MVAYPGALGKPAVAPRPEIEPSPTDLSRLSARMRFLIERGSVGAGGPYPSRSEADFAMAAAMFAKGYSPEEVASLLTDPPLGISGKALEEGANAANYVGCTVLSAPRRSGSASRGGSPSAADSLVGPVIRLPVNAIVPPVHKVSPRSRREGESREAGRVGQQRRSQTLPRDGIPGRGVPTRGVPTRGVPTRGVPTRGVPGALVFRTRIGQAGPVARKVAPSSRVQRSTTAGRCTRTPAPTWPHGHPLAAPAALARSLARGPKHPGPTQCLPWACSGPTLGLSR
jgi:hypothetical protein